MRLNGSQMEQLVALIADGIERSALRRIVRFTLDVDADEIIDDGAKKLDAVFQVVDYSARLQRVAQLIDGISRENDRIAAALQQILEEAERNDSAAATLDHPPAAAEQADPLASYFYEDEPFVDRDDLSQRLRELWRDGRSGVLVVRGERYSGRSQSWWRVLSAAYAARVAIFRIDVSRDPGTWTIDMFIERVAMGIPIKRELLKDGLAQGSAQSAALIAALNEFLRRAAGASRWCLVLDGLDRMGVDPSIIALVEELVAEIVANNLPSLSLVLLGYGEHARQPFVWRILTEKINWIGHDELCAWLTAVARAAGKAADEQKVKEAAESVLKGLKPPFDAEAMDAMRARVKQRAGEMLRGT